MRKAELLAARVVAAVAAVFWGWLFFGLQDTLTVVIEGQDFAAHYVLESGWGLLFLVLVAMPLVGLAYRPRSPVLVAQVAAVGLAVMAGALLAGSAAHLLPGAGVFLTALAVAGCARLRLRPTRLQADWPLVFCVLLAAGPALGYARLMASSTVDVEITWNLDHYPIQAALGIAVVLVAGVIAVAANSPGAPAGYHDARRRGDLDRHRVGRLPAPARQPRHDLGLGGRRVGRDVPRSSATPSPLASHRSS